MPITPAKNRISALKEKLEHELAQMSLFVSPNSEFRRAYLASGFFPYLQEQCHPGQLLPDHATPTPQLIKEFLEFFESAARNRHLVDSVRFLFHPYSVHDPLTLPRLLLCGYMIWAGEDLFLHVTFHFFPHHPRSAKEVFTSCCMAPNPQSGLRPLRVHTKEGNIGRWYYALTDCDWFYSKNFSWGLAHLSSFQEYRHRRFERIRERYRSQGFQFFIPSEAVFDVAPDATQDGGYVPPFTPRVVLAPRPGLPPMVLIQFSGHCYLLSTPLADFVVEMESLFSGGIACATQDAIDRQYQFDANFAFAQSWRSGRPLTLSRLFSLMPKQKGAIEKYIRLLFGWGNFLVQVKGRLQPARSEIKDIVLKYLLEEVSYEEAMTRLSFELLIGEER